MIGDFIEKLSIKFLLVIIGSGIWVLVFQNYIAHFTSKGVEKVYVTGGSISAKSESPLEVKGSVDVNNVVDINVRQINGWRAANYEAYKLEGYEYHALGVTAP